VVSILNIYPTLTVVMMLQSGSRQLCKASESEVQTPARMAYDDNFIIYCSNEQKGMKKILFNKESR